MFNREMKIRIILTILSSAAGIGVYLAQDWLVKQGTVSGVLFVLLGGACVFFLVLLIPKENTTKPSSDSSCNQVYMFPSSQKSNYITPTIQLKWAAIFVVTISFPHNDVRKVNNVNYEPILCSEWGKVESTPRANLVNLDFSHEFRV